MKKIMDKLKNLIRYNKKIMLFLTVVTIIGIITGAFLVVILKNSDKSLVTEYINSFTNNIKTNSFNYIDTLKNTILINILFIIGIWILGISIIGLLIVIIIIFWKAFTLGFTISSFILTYNLKGLILAIIYTFPHLIINLLIIMYLGSYSINFSLLIIKSIVAKKKIELSKLMNRYLAVLLITTSIIIITSIFESFITPILLKKVATFLF